MSIKIIGDNNEIEDRKVIMGTSADITSSENTNDIISKKKSLKSVGEEKIGQPKKNLSNILIEKNYNTILDSGNNKDFTKYHEKNKDEKIIIVLIFIIFSIIFINFYNMYNRDKKYVYTDVKYPLRIG